MTLLLRNGPGVQEGLNATWAQSLGYEPVGSGIWINVLRPLPAETASRSYTSTSSQLCFSASLLIASM